MEKKTSRWLLALSAVFAVGCRLPPEGQPDGGGRRA